MRKIYKYKLETTDLQVVEVPKLDGTSSFKEQLLNIEVQNETPCMWCLVDEKEEAQEIKIRIVGTGNPMPVLSKDDYLGSYMQCDGRLVFHVFLENNVQ